MHSSDRTERFCHTDPSVRRTNAAKPDPRSRCRAWLEEAVTFLVVRDADPGKGVSSHRNVLGPDAIIMCNLRSHTLGLVVTPCFALEAEDAFVDLHAAAPGRSPACEGQASSFEHRPLCSARIIANSVIVSVKGDVRFGRHRVVPEQVGKIHAFNLILYVSAPALLHLMQVEAVLRALEGNQPIAHDVKLRPRPSQLI